MPVSSKLKLSIFTCVLTDKILFELGLLMFEKVLIFLSMKNNCHIVISSNNKNLLVCHLSSRTWRKKFLWPPYHCYMVYPKKYLNKLQLIQNSHARVVTCSPKKFTSCSKLLVQLHWLPIAHILILKSVFLCINQLYTIHHLLQNISKYMMFHTIFGLLMLSH